MSKYDITPPEKNKEPDVDNALIVKYPKGRHVVEDTNAEIEMLKKAFKSPLEQEKELKEKNINPNFWFCVYFQNESQKEEFLKKIGADAITKGIYINGLDLAKLLGVEIQKEQIEKPQKFKVFKKD